MLFFFNFRPTTALGESLRVKKDSRNMNRKLTWVGLVAGLVSSSGSLQAITYNLADLVQSGDSITIGDKIFDDFAFASSFFNPADATVTARIDGNGDYQLTFQGPWILGLGNSANIALSYSIATTSGQPLIESIGQAYVHSAAGMGGTIAIEETAHIGSLAGPVTAMSTLGYVAGLPPTLDLEDPISEAGDDLLVDPTASKLWIKTQIEIAAHRAGLTGPSVIIQTFQQTVVTPEGGLSLAMVGALVVGMGYIRKRLA